LSNDCPYCHHLDARLYRKNQKLRFQEGVRDIFQCNECKTLYPRPRLCPEDIRQLYDSFYTNAEDFSYSDYNRSRIQEGILQYSDRITTSYRQNPLFRLIIGYDFPAGKKALDIGAFSGWFCYLLEKAGFEAWGIEPQHYAVEFAKRKGFRVFKGYFPNNIPEPIMIQKYTLISALECIYYFFDLKEALNKIWNMLESGGIFLLKCHQGQSTCYEDGSSLFSRFGDFVQGIPVFDSLRYCLEHSGFKVEKIYPYPEDFLRNYYKIQLPPLLKKVEYYINKKHPKLFFNPKRAHNLVTVARKDKRI